MHVSATIKALSLFLLLGGIPACEKESPPPPLRPLIFTEQQNKDPRLAKIREERFLRTLMGKNIQEKISLPVRSDDAQVFGQEIFQRLIGRDKVLWEHLWFDAFVFAQEYGESIADAKEHRDLSIAKTSPLWEQFDPGQPTQARKKGLASLLEFRKLVLGHPEQGVDATHYSDNLLIMQLREAHIEIRFKIKTIVRKNNKLGLLSTISENSLLSFIRVLGFHLRGDLQEPESYFIPLKVGNYWRYKLTENAKDLSASDIFEEGLSTQNGASTKTIEVKSVDRIEGRRLVEFLISYDDQEKKQYTERWLTTPTMIFPCGDRCVKNFSNLKKLIFSLKDLPPLFSFDNDVLGKRTEESLNLELPMGQFDDVFEINQKASPNSVDPSMNYPQTIYLKPHLGIVRRSVERPEKRHELLIAYRLLP